MCIYLPPHWGELTVYRLKSNSSLGMGDNREVTSKIVWSLSIYGFVEMPENSKLKERVGSKCYAGGPEQGAKEDGV